MNKSNVLNKQTARRILLTMLVVVLAMAFVAALPKSAHAGDVTVPDMPDNIKVTGGKAFLVGHAIGTQNYVCQPSGAGVAYILFTPQATLFGEDGGKIISHFFSPNPDEPNADPKVVSPGGTIRATWEYKDASSVWAATVPNGASTDPKFVEKDAVAWLKLEAKGLQDGPTGGDKLSDNTSFVQRLNTHGGVAPSTGCSTLADVGNKAFVPYTADYFFYHGGE